MPARPKRRCINCRQLTTRGDTCDRCYRQRRQERDRQRQGRYPPAERTRMRAAVADHRATHGDICPGYNRPAHPAQDLTADHIIPINQGGLGGPLTVLCRTCNSRKGQKQTH